MKDSETVICDEYAKEYIKEFNMVCDFLDTMLWEAIFLKHGKNFLSTRFPLSTIPVIEKIYNDVKSTLNERIKNLLDEETGILKKLENNLSSLYLKTDYRYKFVQSALSSKDVHSINDIEKLLDVLYKHMEKLTFDDARPSNYNTLKNKYEFLIQHFFNLNEKYSYTIPL